MATENGCSAAGLENCALVIPPVDTSPFGRSVVVLEESDSRQFFL